MSPSLFPRLLIISSILLASPFITLPLNAQSPPAPTTSPPLNAAPPWLGVILDKKTLHSDDGITVERVMRKSPAEKAGILPGDRILQIDGQTVQSTGKLQMLIRGQTVGATVKLSVSRAQKHMEFHAVLTPTPTEQQRIEVQLLHEFPPSLTLEILSPETNTLQLARLKGRPTIIEFWATWCQPCKAVAAQLSNLQSQYGDQIHIVSISSEDPKTLNAFIQKNGAPPYLLARDPGEKTHQAFFVSSYPIVFLLNAEHRIEGIYIGSSQHQQLETRLKTLLASTENDQTIKENKEIKKPKHKKADR